MATTTHAQLVTDAAKKLNMSQQELLRKPPYIIRRMLQQQLDTDRFKAPAIKPDTLTSKRASPIPTPKPTTSPKTIDRAHTNKTEIDFNLRGNQPQNFTERSKFLNKCILETKNTLATLKQLKHTVRDDDVTVLDREIKRLHDICKYSQLELDEIQRSLQSEIDTLTTLCETLKPLNVSTKTRRHFAERLNKMQKQLKTT